MGPIAAMLSPGGESRQAWPPGSSSSWAVRCRSGHHRPDQVVRIALENAQLQEKRSVCQDKWSRATPPALAWHEMRARDHRSEQVRLLDEPADWEVKSTALRIPAGDVTLIGDREVPAGATGLVLFAHGSGSEFYKDFSQTNERRSRRCPPESPDELRVAP